ERELSAGIAEVIKYGLICDYDFFVWLETNMPALMNRDKAALAYAVERSCQNKALVVAQMSMKVVSAQYLIWVTPLATQLKLHKATATGCTVRQWPQAWQWPRISPGEEAQLMMQSYRAYIKYWS